MTTERYRFCFGDDTVYGRVVALVEEFNAGAGSTIVDLGCGYGALAERVQELGFNYLGLDAEDDAILDLKARGFEAAKTDLHDVDRTVAQLAEHLQGRRLGALLMIDSLEHLTNGAELLRELASLSAGAGGAPLVLSVPNVTHVDVAAKLLMGRWDVTKTGLLDETHVAFFSERRLEECTRQAGWVRIGESDFVLPESDQHFPEHAPTLESGTPLREFLMQLRFESSSGALVNQFVRAYAPIPRPAEAVGPPLGTAPSGQRAEPFLSVLVRTQGTRPTTLNETLLSLAAQRDQDFEVVLLAHNMPRERTAELRYLAQGYGEDFSRRVEVVPVDGGGRSRPLNVGVSVASGSYVAILDDDDVVFGHWVETFKAAAAKTPGRVLRTVPAEQDISPITWAGTVPGYQIAGRPRCPWPKTFDALGHIFENGSPPCCYALPRSAFSDLGLRFDESLPVMEDWDVFIRVALLAGVADAEQVTSLWRRWRRGGDSSLHVHTVTEWQRARSAIAAKLDAGPLLLPGRSASTIQEMTQRNRELQSEVEVLERTCRELGQSAHDATRTVEDMRRSTSWKLSAPIRMASRLARRIASKT